MAYSVKYRFNFDSDQGSAFRIDVLKDGYGHTSPILMRHIGGSPVIRREKSGCICGTSLEFPAECAVDGEFEEFKTSVPFTFKVNVYGGTNYGTLIWTGYVTPELMEAPDIAPPYDVQVCCTDGLGELKYTDFPARGGQTLWNHLTYLLGLTGLSLSVTVVNDITHGSVAASRFLHETAVSLDNLAGETCYDVLQAILTSIHATITQADGKWLIFRETGADVDTSTPSIDNAYVDGSTTASPIPVQEYGSAGSHARWPVGHMTHGNVPPRKGMVLTTDNNYFPNILSDAVWQAVANGVNAGSYWQFPAAGDGMKNMGVSFNEAIRQKLLLTIKVRNVGSGTDAGKLSVKVKAVGTAYSGSMTYYLANGTYGRRNPTTNFTWVNDEQDSVIEVQAPESTDSDDDYVEIGIVIPAYRNSAYDYFYLSSLDLTISNSDGTYEQRVYGVSLSKYEQFAGFKKEILLDNGARGKGDDVALAFSPVVGANDYVGVQELQYGMLFEPVGSASIPTLKSATFTTAMDYLSLMARDYALSIAGARTYVRGALNVPVGTALIPVAFKDSYDSKVYFVDTLSWDLYQDEMTVEMTSVPATAITVDDEVNESGVSGNATGHQQAQSSSSGGGGGGGGTGTVTSVGVTVPDEFSVSGSPVTTSGTIRISLKSTYKIPSTSEWNNVSGKAHTHDNKSTLDLIDAGYMAAIDSAIADAHVHSNLNALSQITATKISHWDSAYEAISELDISSQDIEHWDDAYDAAHTHSNMAVLNGITAAKVAQWDANSGGGSVYSVGLEMPAAFEVSGSPITDAGTFQVSLASGYKIPTTSEWNSLDSAKHTHSNKSLLDDISAQDIADWDDAVSKEHTHSNKSVLDGITSSKVGNWDDAASAAHSHANKSALDTITTNEIAGWDAAASAAHSHSNKSVLDGISSSDVTAWDGAVTNSHSHGNKTVLDGITSSKVSNWDAAYTDKHTHSNKNTLDGISATQVGQWDDAYGAMHTHSNKSVLDGIDATKVAAWDAAAGGDTIDVSIGGTAAAPTVAVALGTGSSDAVALPAAGSSAAGIVTTGAQTFGGNKTFTRIYLGDSESYGMYIEWDASAHMFKIVGDAYFTGDIAVGG